MHNKDKRDFLIKILAVVVILLLGVLCYVFLISPAINSYAVKAYNQGVQTAIITIAQQAAQCKQVPLTVENQTINLFAVECMQQNIGTQTSGTISK